MEPLEQSSDDQKWDKGTWRSEEEWRQYWPQRSHDQLELLGVEESEGDMLSHRLLWKTINPPYQVALLARTPPSLSIRPYHSSLLSGLPDYMLSTQRIGRYILVGRLTLACLFKGFHRRTSQGVHPCFSSKSCSYYLDSFRNGSKCSCFVGCYFQDLFNIVHSFLWSSRLAFPLYV